MNESTKLVESLDEIKLRLYTQPFTLERVSLLLEMAYYLGKKDAISEVGKDLGVKVRA